MLLSEYKNSFILQGRAKFVVITVFFSKTVDFDKCEHMFIKRFLLQSQGFEGVIWEDTEREREGNIHNHDFLFCFVKNGEHFVLNAARGKVVQ